MSPYRSFLASSALALATILTSTAADWRGALDENFQSLENWIEEGSNQSVSAPIAGDRNKTSLTVQNGPKAALSYTSNDGETGFTGQLLVGQHKGRSGEMIVSGGVLSVNLEEKWSAIVGQTVEGNLKVTGGVLNLLAGQERMMPAGLTSSWGLIIGNEPSGIGAVEISGGEVNVGGGLWLGRASGSGSLEVSGSGRLVCEGPILLSGGINTQGIQFGPGAGRVEASLDGEVHFPAEDGRNVSVINFTKGSRGTLALQGRGREYFDRLVRDGKIRIDGSPARPENFVFRQNGGLGEYSPTP